MLLLFPMLPCTTIKSFHYENSKNIQKFILSFYFLFCMTLSNWEKIGIEQFLWWANQLITINTQDFWDSLTLSWNSVETDSGVSRVVWHDNYRHRQCHCHFSWLRINRRTRLNFFKRLNRKVARAIRSWRHETKVETWN